VESTGISSRRCLAKCRATGAAILCVLAAGGAWSAGAGSPAQELQLTSKQAHCLADNAELLLRDKGDPVTFYFDLCLADAAARGGSRQSLPDVPKPATRASGAAQRTDGPIKVSKAHLRCIQEKKAQEPAFLDASPVLLNPSACQK
jgi:hypothetical protein